MAPLIVRPLHPSDSLLELTALLHRAYGRLGAMGLNYTAVDQLPATTRERVKGNECYVAEEEGRIVGTVVLHADQRDRPACACSDDTAYLSQFAVEPGLQGRGIGARLLDHIEARAAAMGFRAIALDTAIPATHLVAYYARRGYRTIGEVRFPGKTYTSVVMSKGLGAAEGRSA
jgi:GNAT superfamily N-acetyltransferase